MEFQRPPWPCSTQAFWISSSIEAGVGFQSFLPLYGDDAGCMVHPEGPLGQGVIAQLGTGLLEGQVTLLCFEGAADLLNEQVHI